MSRGILAVLGLAALCAAFTVEAGSAYTAISPSASDRTVTLTGRDLTIDQIVMVARGGAKVQLSAQALQREADNYGLLLEASAEGIPVYWFNRGTGDQRETVMFDGDPLSPANRALIEKTQLDAFRAGALWGTGRKCRTRTSSER
jgi:histidine ammonia-lyase